MVHNSLKTCERKIAYKTWAQAMAARLSLMNAGKDDGSVKPYFCNLCHKYHLGHKR